MTSDLIFLGQVLTVVVLPLAVLRLTRLRGLVPLVVAQILVGIALGPSLFGRLAPDFYQMFFHREALSQLSGIASVAVLIFGLITGLHLEPATFRGSGRAYMLVATASVAVPTALGFAAGLWIALRHPEELGNRVTVVQFAGAIGICVGVTALPVLGAILHEMNLLGRRIGNLALAIAGFNDGALWILLGLLLTDVSGHATEGPGVLVTLIVLPVYLVLMATGARPLMRRMIIRRMKDGEIREGALALVFAVTIGSALITQTLGLHYILGAFVAGAITPEELRQPIMARLQVMTISLLMPFFFLITGLRTFIDLSPSIFLEVLIVSTAVAVLGKVGGTAAAARFMGETWHMSLGLGALLQTKGLMELIVLTILLDQGIISVNVFSALVLMAVATTALAQPLARFALAHESAAGIKEHMS
jgi:Kef-type K+ transport system membrane component KefB